MNHAQQDSFRHGNVTVTRMILANASPNVNQRLVPMFCFPELGTNCELCYKSFFSDRETQFLRQIFAIYSVEVHGFASSARDEPSYNYSYESLVDDLSAIVQEHKDQFCVIKSHLEKQQPFFHGMGTGSGGYLLSLFACTHPHLVESMVLISSPIHGASWLESFQMHARQWRANLGGGVDAYSKKLMSLYFSEKFRQLPSHEYILNEFHEYHVLSFEQLKYDIQLNTKRKDLSDQLKKLCCKVLILVGEESAYFNDASYNLDKFDPELVSWIKVPNCGGLITREKPEQIITSLKLFLQSQSFMLDTIVESHPNPLSITVL